MNLDKLLTELAAAKSGAAARPWSEVPHDPCHTLTLGPDDGGRPVFRTPGNTPNARFALWAANHIEEFVAIAIAQANYIALLEEQMQDYPTIHPNAPADPNIVVGMEGQVIDVRCRKCNNGWHNATVRCSFCNPT